jgi:hypothetical protein
MRPAGVRTPLAFRTLAMPKAIGKDIAANPISEKEWPHKVGLRQPYPKPL